ncbi:hypothetical protein [Fibrella aestuarina]|nr:hypothetical protein [Fibrella aestuarina]
MKRFLRSALTPLLILAFVSAANAQFLITRDSLSAVPVNRGSLFFNPNNQSLSVRYNNGTNTTLYRLFVGTLTQGLGDARYAQLSGSYANPSWISSLAFSKLTSTPTTAAGYGITDAVVTGGTYNNPTWLAGLDASKLNAGTLLAARLGTFTGDVTTAGGSYATTISTNAVSNTKLAQMPTMTFKGNNTGATANAIDLTVGQTKTALLLDQVDNTSDANKPVSTAAATAIALKSSAVELTVSNLAHGGTITHNLNSSKVTVLFRPTGSNFYDMNYTWSAGTANTITLVSPYDGAGTRESFSGTITVETAN